MIKKEINILIIGIGNIGFRHFEATNKIPLNKNIHILDKYKVIKNLKKNIKSNTYNKIFFHQSMETLPKKIDLVTISTTSKIRSKIIKKLLTKSKIKFMILEKFLFQKISDYRNNLKRLKKHKIYSWVNCQRRAFPFYQNLKKKIRKGSIEMIVKGNRWNLMSNSIHFLDLFFFLSGEKKIKLIKNDLSKKVLNSKRTGFISLFGKISINFFDSSKIIFEDKNEKKNNIIITIKNNDKKFSIVEKPRKIKLKITRKNKISTKLYKNFLTSEIMTIILKQILLSGKSHLPSLKESTSHHLILLNVFLLHLRKINKKTIHNCRIT